MGSKCTLADVADKSWLLHLVIGGETVSELAEGLEAMARELRIYAEPSWGEIVGEGIVQGSYGAGPQCELEFGTRDWMLEDSKCES